jgi:hypothetical protein
MEIELLRKISSYDPEDGSWIALDGFIEELWTDYTPNKEWIVYFMKLF